MPAERDSSRGLIAASLAYVIWGLVVVYWKLLPGVSPWEILAHRVVWCLVLLTPIVLALGRGPVIFAALRSPRTLFMMLVSSTLIGINWGLFIWAVSEGRIVETSLGYYINPLLAIGLGVVLLGENLSIFRILAFLLAGCGVAIQAVHLGGLPWVSLGLATTFALYGYVRKVVIVEALDGLFIETMVIAPIALAALIYMSSIGALVFGTGAFHETALLAGAGPITAAPLWLFAVGARRVRLSTIGFLQYISPTISLLLAVLVYHEPFDSTRLISFGLIWSALFVVSLEMFRRQPLVPARAS